MSESELDYRISNANTKKKSVVLTDRLDNIKCYALAALQVNKAIYPLLAFQAVLVL